MIIPRKALFAIARKSRTLIGWSSMCSIAPTKRTVQYFERDFDHTDVVSAGNAWEKSVIEHLKSSSLLEESKRSLSVAAAATPESSLRAWQRFHSAHRGSFYHARSYIAAAYDELCCGNTAALSDCLRTNSAEAGRHYGRTCSSDAEGTLLTILELGAGNGSNLFTILEANPRARLFASDFSRAALKFITRVAAARAAAPADGHPAGKADVADDHGVLHEAVPPARCTEGAADAATDAADGAQSQSLPFTLFLYDCVTGGAPVPSEFAASSRSSSPVERRGKGGGKSKKIGAASGPGLVASADCKAAVAPLSTTEAAVVAATADAKAPTTASASLPEAAAAAPSPRLTGGVDWSAQPAVVHRGCDVVLCTFVLSAIAPELQLAALRNIRRLLRPGAVLLFRDYGLYDSAMLRARPAAVLSPRVHVRGEGTLACYFEPVQLNELLVQAGFALLEPGGARYCTVLARNRRLELEMKRVFVTAKAVALPDELLPAGHPDRLGEDAAAGGAGFDGGSTAVPVSSGL